MLEKLLAIQAELVAPKNQYNKFGGYNYRSCEDILEGLKPLLKKYKATVTIQDSLEIVGDRVYVKATVRFIDTESGESHEVTAYAKEPQMQKGMVDGQLTGATSSYARKYALNGMFLIDDNKDADSNEFGKQTGAKNKRGDTAEEAELNEQMERNAKASPITPAEIATLKSLCAKKGLKVEETFPNGVENMNGEQFAQAVDRLKGIKDKA